jgi:protein AaeX
VNFTEIDLFGVYVAPISIMMIGAWLIFVPVRRLADHFGLFREVWHPALFWFAIYMILLSAIVLFAAL